MLVPYISPVSSFIYTGVTTFPVAFPFQRLTSIAVACRADAQEGEGLPTIFFLTYGVDLSVTGVPAGELDSHSAYVSGSVTLTAAGVQKLAMGNTVVVYRDTYIDQDFSYTELDNFPAKSHENALGRLTLIAQEHAEKLSRAVLLSWGSDIDAETFKKLL